MTVAAAARERAFCSQDSNFTRETGPRTQIPRPAAGQPGGRAAALKHAAAPLRSNGTGCACPMWWPAQAGPLANLPGATRLQAESRTAAGKQTARYGVYGGGHDSTRA
ncbi:hypothetical protein BVI1335_2090002 [Burkholderia vietnamiensis]|nr:hypothetical protein BVI1335_2090002 [Burkholderia vietnamiensis]